MKAKIQRAQERYHVGQIKVIEVDGKKVRTFSHNEALLVRESVFQVKVSGGLWGWQEFWL